MSPDSVQEKLFNDFDFQENINLAAYKEKKMRWYRRRYANTLLISVDCDEPNEKLKWADYHLEPKKKNNGLT